MHDEQVVGRSAGMSEEEPLMDRFSLRDRVALITGAGRGIGAGIARGFVEAGAAVAVVARTRADVESLAEEIDAGGGRALALVADVTDLDALAGRVERTVDHFGGLDVLVNNAGGEVSPPFLDTRVDHIKDAIHFNVLVPFELARLAVPHLLERPGASIINISSTTTLVSVRGSLAHHTGKTAESQLTLSMAADLGPRIRVNAILPGVIETEALARFFEQKDASLRDVLADHIRMKRMGTPDDVASAAIYLASPAASWVTGLLLEVDGGQIDEIKPVYPDL
jgi:7-alpha-hydroxysteroid dehydrogenase